MLTSDIMYIDSISQITLREGWESLTNALSHGYMWTLVQLQLWFICIFLNLQVNSQRFYLSRVCQQQNMYSR